MIGSLVNSAVLVADVAAKTKESALKELVAAAQTAGSFDEKTAKTLYKRLQERETIGSTGLGNGVAVPHVKGDDLGRVVMVLARSKKGLEWQAIDGRPCTFSSCSCRPPASPSCTCSACGGLPVWLAARTSAGS
jgi:mannitol/fructose-specific phosphotransferase system IIA component (Ntr-type)